jgi:hypothetical protein
MLWAALQGRSLERNLLAGGRVDHRVHLRHASAAQNRELLIAVSDQVRA